MFWFDLIWNILMSYKTSLDVRLAMFNRMCEYPHFCPRNSSVGTGTRIFIVYRLADLQPVKWFTLCNCKSALFSMYTSILKTVSDTHRRRINIFQNVKKYYLLKLEYLKKKQCSITKVQVFQSCRSSIE